MKDELKTRHGASAPRSAFVLSVALFARARDLAGGERLDLEMPAGATVAVLRETLVERVPALAALLTRSAIAVNHDFAEDTQVLKAGDEAAVIPPVSGG